MFLGGMGHYAIAASCVSARNLRKIPLKFTILTIATMALLTFLAFIITGWYWPDTTTNEYDLYPLKWAVDGTLIAQRDDTIWFNLDDNGRIKGIPEPDGYRSLKIIEDEKFRSHPHVVFTSRKCGEKDHTWSFCGDEYSEYIFLIPPGALLNLNDQ
jgi:hypothetical protein